MVNAYRNWKDVLFLCHAGGRQHLVIDQLRALAAGIPDLGSSLRSNDDNAAFIGSPSPTRVSIIHT